MPVPIIAIIIIIVIAGAGGGAYYAYQAGYLNDVFKAPEKQNTETAANTSGEQATPQVIQTITPTAYP